MSSIRWFRIIALLEGISLLLLVFIAMPLKYIFDLPLAVQWVGLLHGLLFIAYCFYGLYLCITYRWRFTYGLKLFAAAFFPFGTFFMDKSLKQKESA